MPRRLPTAALALGIAGVVPFIVLGIQALRPGDDAESQRYLLALVGYGAVVLGFLGGIHWGFVLHPAALPEGMTPDQRRDAGRLSLGVLPSLIGWAALLTPLLGIPEVGLAVLIVGFIATVAYEARLADRSSLPAGYLAMRWALSVIVLVVLVTVLALRLIGAKIMF